MKQLRDKYNVKASEAVTSRSKEQTKTINKIVKSVSSGPKTIPEISKMVELDMRTTAWFVFTLTRHKRLQAVEKTEEGYWLYAPATEEGD